MIKHFDHVATFDCPEPGSFHSKVAFVLELSTGKLQKFKKHNLFDTKSLQIGELPTRNPKFIKNRVLFRKHRILRYKIKTPLKFRFAEAKTMVASAFCDQKKTWLGDFSTPGTLELWF